MYRINAALTFSPENTKDLWRAPSSSPFQMQMVNARTATDILLFFVRYARAYGRRRKNTFFRPCPNRFPRWLLQQQPRKTDVLFLVSHVQIDYNNNSIIITWYDDYDDNTTVLRVQEPLASRFRYTRNNIRRSISSVHCV